MNNDADNKQHISMSRLSSIETEVTNAPPLQHNLSNVKDLWLLIQEEKTSTQIICKLAVHYDTSRSIQLIESVINVYASISSLPFLVKTCVRYKCRNQKQDDNIMVLFRSNDFATKVITTAFNKVGNDYMYDRVLLPLIKSLSDVDYDDMNQHQLCTYVQQFVKTISNSRTTQSTSFLELRRLCTCIYNELNSVYASEATALLTSLLFLRYINPLIVNPHRLKQLPNRRLLITIAKAIQYTCTMNPKNKEQFDYLNERVDELSNDIKTFINSLRHDDDDCSELHCSKPMKDDIANELLIIQNELNMKPKSLRQKLMAKIKRKKHVDIRIVERNKCSTCVPIIMFINLLVIIILFYIFHQLLI